MPFRKGSFESNAGLTKNYNNCKKIIFYFWHKKKQTRGICGNLETVSASASFLSKSKTVLCNNVDEKTTDVIECINQPWQVACASIVSEQTN